MTPILSVEFTVRAADGEFSEESVAIHSPGEFFEYVAPGGGCERIPDEVGEINVAFLRPAHANTGNPVADLYATLQIGMVFLTGPLAEIVQLADGIRDRAGRGELSGAFLRVIGAGK
ncbi:MAG: hypothetical protein PVJ66_00155 [Gammaproteobacteria bacterium]|jgi:hypothetical protein